MLKHVSATRPRLTSPVKGVSRRTPDRSPVARLAADTSQQAVQHAVRAVSPARAPGIDSALQARMEHTLAEAGAAIRELTGVMRSLSPAARAHTGGPTMLTQDEEEHAADVRALAALLQTDATAESGGKREIDTAAESTPPRSISAVPSSPRPCNILKPAPAGRSEVSALGKKDTASVPPMAGHNRPPSAAAAQLARAATIREVAKIPPEVIARVNSADISWLEISLPSSHPARKLLNLGAADKHIRLALTEEDSVAEVQSPKLSKSPTRDGVGRARAAPAVQLPAAARSTGAATKSTTSSQALVAKQETRSSPKSTAPAAAVDRVLLTAALDSMEDAASAAAALAARSSSLRFLTNAMRGIVALDAAVMDNIVAQDVFGAHSSSSRPDTAHVWQEALAGVDGAGQRAIITPGAEASLTKARALLQELQSMQSRLQLAGRAAAACISLCKRVAAGDAGAIAHVERKGIAMPKVYALLSRSDRLAQAVQMFMNTRMQAHRKAMQERAAGDESIGQHTAYRSSTSARAAAQPGISPRSRQELTEEILLLQRRLHASE